MGRCPFLCWLCFLPASIQHAVWLYLRYKAGYRDIEELPTEREPGISHESVRYWDAKVGPRFARELQWQRLRPADRWQAEEMMRIIIGSQLHRWRTGERDRQAQVEAQIIYAALRSNSPLLSMAVKSSG